ncbi:MAG TPA: hypothetical protein VJ861_05505 [Treponemataceae bacterium]|nr:hypothetical protein [Treponemataceae bacterium]
MKLRIKEKQSEQEFNMDKKLNYLPIGRQIWVKSRDLYSYNQPLHSILKERDATSVELAGYLKELGYE